MSEREADRWETPEISTRPMRCMLLYFEKTYGRPRLESVFQKLPLSLEFVEDLRNFVSYAFLERMLDDLTLASADPDFVDRAGHYIATPEGLGFGWYLLRSVGSPELAYRKSIELGATYNRVGKFEVEKSAPNELVLTYKSTVPEHNRLSCRGRMSNFAAFPTIWKLPFADVKELQCQVEGAECCRYHLRWQRPLPKTWRRWVGLLMGGVVGALVFASFVPAVMLAMATFFAGAWFDLHLVAREREKMLVQNTDQLTRSTIDLQKRADEIFKANVELDSRVNARTADLQDALARLRKVDQLKSEFFANVSHELRTPLTLILTPVEEELSKASDDVRKTLLNGVQRNATRLLHLIDDLLDLSRIDAGHLQLSVSPVDLSQLARSLGQLFAPAAEVRGIRFEVDAPAATGELFGDLHRLDSVVSNLVGNALKFTPRGGLISLTVKDLGDSVSLSVADSGPGIKPKDLERIFDRFYQVEQEHGSKGGVGIGLSLARNLAELHHGSLQATSEVGHGATFTLTLPKGRAHLADALTRPLAQATMGGVNVRRPTATDAPTTPAAPVQVVHTGATLAVVEDHDELRALLKTLLSGSFRVVDAPDGLAGWALIQKERPDLVLSDVMMPGLTGAQLCAKIKADPQLKTTPVILLTARSGPEAALEGFQAGADEFIEKPFHPQVLLARVNAQLKLRLLATQIANQSRLAAVGTLAAGVGHEVRNPLNAVLNGVKVLQVRNAVEPGYAKLLEVISDGATRIEQISAALLQHARPAEKGGHRPVDVREGLDSTLRLIEHRLGEVSVHQTVEARSTVIAPAAELNQVFLNLVDNSVRAGARNLWLKSENGQGRLKVSVEDDGKGVPVEVATRIFDAFFTTREPGEGTGLGLYLCRESVQRWGGDISYRPRPGGGSVFTVELPGQVEALPVQTPSAPRPEAR